MEQALELRKHGKSIRDIAMQLGVSKSRIGQIVKNSELSNGVHVSRDVDSVDGVDKEEPDATLFQPWEVP